MTMTMRTITTLTCDVCGAQLVRELRQAPAVREARELGWTVARYVGEWGVRCPQHARAAYPYLGR
jgi:hypothetical protein